MNISQKHNPTARITARKTMLGALRAVAALTMAQPVAAQDGKIAFTQYLGPIGTAQYLGLFVMNGDGTNLTQVHLQKTYYSNPSLSPDGSKIAVNVGSDLYVMTADGTGLRRLVKATIYYLPVEGAVFTHDGSRIMFMQGDPQLARNIYTIRPDGTDRQQIPNVQVPPRSGFSLSADDNTIAYSVSEPAGGRDTFHIYTQDLTTLEKKRLTNAGIGISDGSPRFTFDGSQIVFYRDDLATTGASARDGYYIMNADGTDSKQIPISPYSYIALSPDSQRIAFAVDDTISSIKNDGSDLKLLLKRNIVFNDVTPTPSWSSGFVPPHAIANINDASVLEGDSGSKDMFFTVRLSKPAPFQAEVDYVTANGTATGFYDYTRVSGTLHFEPGEQSKTIRVPVLGDTEDETDETLFVRLSNGKNLNLGDDEGVGVILSDEVPKAPSNVSLTPTSETSGPGEARIFTAVYRDPNFTQDIASAMLRVGNNNSGSLRVSYNPGTNKLYLLNDAGTAYLGGFAPGSAQVISNKQGSLNCAATSVSRAGELLTVSWSLTPSSAFMGVHDLYLLVRDRTGLVAGWDDLGVWSITANLPPVNVSLSPDDVTIAAGSAQTLSAKYSDPNGASDLVSVMLRVGDHNVGGLRGIYNPLTNKLYLLSDDGKSYLGGFAPGAAQIISNGQGSLDCSRTSASKSGDNLTVNWNFTLSSGYAGPHTLSLLARDLANQSDGWDALGIWH